MRTKERVREYADKHPTATVREIQTALGLSSPSVVQFHLKVDSKDNIIEAKDKRIAELEAENARLHEILDDGSLHVIDEKLVPWPKKKSPSEKEIMAAKTKAGGWKRSTLEKWGVPWPPPKGWKKALIAK